MKTRPILNINPAFLLFFMAALCGETGDDPSNAMNSAAYPSYARAIYGFSSDSAPFKTTPIADIPVWLIDHGVNAVFVSAREKTEVLSTLGNAGIICLQEFTVFSSRELYREHPEWRPIAADGSEVKPDGWYYGLSPTQPDLRKKRLEEFRQRLKNPWIQGIWLDFIRYAVRWEKPNPTRIDNCFSPTSLQQFERSIKTSLPGTSVAEKSRFILERRKDDWENFKAQTICSWVEEARKIRDAERPEVKIGLFGVPWTRSDYSGAIRNLVGQDFAALAQSVDIFSPMVYHRLCGRNPDWIGKVTREVKEQTQKPVWPVIQATSEPGVMDSSEFQQAVLEGANASNGGVILFTADHIEKEKRWQDVQKLFHQIPEK